MNPRNLTVVVADANLRAHRDLLEAESPSGTEFRWVDAAGAADAMPGADVLVGAMFSAAHAAGADALQLIHVAGAGYDGIDRDAVPAGVSVANTFHHEGSIAEHIVATAIMLRRGIVEQDRALREDRWASSVYEPERAQPSSLEGATIGFVGFGHIGQRAFRAFRALGARGIAVTRSGEVSADLRGELDRVERVDRIDALLTDADVVVLCLPLSDETRGLIDADALALMRPGAVLVNVARGPVVDPDALFDALEAGRIGGAVLDTWYSYPTEGSVASPAPRPFGELPNVVMTPHSSGVTAQTFRGRVHDIAANITRLASGRALERVVFEKGATER